MLDLEDFDDLEVFGEIESSRGPNSVRHRRNPFDLPDDDFQYT